MPPAAERLRKIKRFDQLLAYLRDELDWPVEEYEFDDLTYDWEPEELGIDLKLAAKIQEIKQMRPLATDQEWGIFFVKFEPKKLPMVAMRRLLNRLVLKQRASANKSDQAKWKMHDLLFISQYGEGEERKISFAQFAQSNTGNLADLKVLAWGETQTDLTLDALDQKLRNNLTWPSDPSDSETWRKQWSAAFTRRHGHVIRTSKELAEQLATLARGIFSEAEKILEIENENGPLTKLYKAFQQALIHDLEPKDFADMYAQTITYGLFSTAVSGTVEDCPFGGNTFVNTERMVELVPNTNPFLREMLSTFLTAGGEKGGLNFDELGINEVVELLNDEKTDLPAIIREFGARKKDEDPVIHFYEEFLKAYNAKLRFQRGVFYTPQPVVSYIVRSVHELLQTEFGLEDGLADITTWGEMVERFNGGNPKRARGKDTNESDESREQLTIPEGMTADDPFVQILDPATGTATFLVEVIDVIERTCKAKWCKQILGHAYNHDRDRKLPELLKPWNEYVPQHLLPRVYGYELMMAPYAIAHVKIGLKLNETGYGFGSQERARVFLTNSIATADIDNQKILGDWFPALAKEAESVAEVKHRRRFTVLVGNPPYAGNSSNSSTDKHGNLTFIGKLIEDYKLINGEKIDEKQIKWLQDDYVKFLRIAERTIVQSGIGVVAKITNHSYMDNPTFRAMRWNLLKSFSNIDLLDLHGNQKKKEVCPDGSVDENVFDILQGVGIFLGRKLPSTSTGTELRTCSLWGLRETKYSALTGSSWLTSTWEPVSPNVPFFLFVYQNATLELEFSQAVKITDILPQNNVGLVTARDSFATDIDKSKLKTRIAKLRDADTSSSELRKTYGLKDTSSWKLEKARKQLQADEKWKSHFNKCLYRPFDTRHIFYTKMVVERPVKQIQRHMLSGGNLAIAVGRAGQVIDQGTWNIVIITNSMTEFNLFRRGGNCLCPLYLRPEEDGLLGNTKTAKNDFMNISEQFLNQLATAIGKPIVNDGKGNVNVKDIAPEQLMSYIYAQLFSPNYRERYAEFLKLDFPRIFLPKSENLFRRLQNLGDDLITNHLLKFELAPSDTCFNGAQSPEVVKAKYENQTVWLESQKRNCFVEIPEKTWNFQIGGYQPLEKWLKDRQAKGGKNPRPGRKLTKEDIEHYQKMVVAIRETIRLMGEIDEVIEQHGGWPDAFVTEPLETTDSEDSPPLA